MFDETRWIGFLGTALVIIAYLPQIHHLIKEHCSGGISIKAYCLWFVAALLMLVHAVGIQDPVFIALQGYQIGASALIVYFGRKYKDSLCEAHRHPQPSFK